MSRFEVTILLALTALVSAARADVIIEHAGSTDPLTEGWDVSIGAGVETGASEGGASWYVRDMSSAAGTCAVHAIWTRFDTDTLRYDMWISETLDGEPGGILPQLSGGVVVHRRGLRVQTMRARLVPVPLRHRS